MVMPEEESLEATFENTLKHTQTVWLDAKRTYLTAGQGKVVGLFLRL